MAKAITVAPVVIAVPDLLQKLAELGIDPAHITEVHMDLARVTVKRTVRLPEGAIPGGGDSFESIETYPIVRIPA